MALPVAGFGPGGTISTFATPLPPGPGSVPLPFPAAPFAAPVLLPVGAPTAASVAVYQYPSPATSAVLSGCDAPGACAASHFWASAEFLYAASSGMNVPPLVTLAPAGSTYGFGGALNSPTTQVLFGDDRDVNSFRPGFRLTVGYRCDDGNGFDASFLYLGRQSEGVSANSAPGGVVLARPIVLQPVQGITSFPVAGVTLDSLAQIGGVTAGVSTFLAGADVNYRRALNCGGCTQLELIAGYRYLHLGDTADVWTTSSPLPVITGVPILPGQAFLTHDSWRTRNNFHGPQFGLAVRRPLGCGFDLEAMTKLAMGVTIASADVQGATTILPAGTVLATGLLAGPTNAVAVTRTDFAVIPEGVLKLGYSCADRLRLTGGYTFLYWSTVRRASEQIDRNVGAGAPAYRDVSTGVWVHGLTSGVEWRF